jgi:hypothetical protein
MDCYHWRPGRLDLDQESRRCRWQLDRQTHRLHRDDRLMKAIRCVGFALVALAALLLLANPSQAGSGSVRVTVTKAGLEVSANVSAVVITLDPSRSTPN